MSGNGVLGPVNAEESCEPKQLIQRLVANLSCREFDAGAATPVLMQLSQALSHRFEREDDDFDTAIQRAPWVTAGVLQLKEQHEQILRIVDELQIRMQDKDNSVDWSAGLGEQLERLVDLFHEHDVAECSLLQESCDQPDWTLD